ncbi:hypothetical protein CHARACLAT_012721, partial [Characodon lateralis]|nr:hypothetical protein [Characodon lateralis]
MFICEVKPKSFPLSPLGPAFPVYSQNKPSITPFGQPMAVPGMSNNPFMVSMHCLMFSPVFLRLFKVFSKPISLYKFRPTRNISSAAVLFPCWCVESNLGCSFFSGRTTSWV